MNEKCYNNNRARHEGGNKLLGHNVVYSMTLYEVRKRRSRSVSKREYEWGVAEF